MAVTYSKPLSNIQSAATGNTWFFNEGAITAIGETLFNSFNTVAPRLLNPSGESLQNGKLKLSSTGNVYIGSFESEQSREHREKYVAFFYQKSSTTITPSLKLTFKNGIIDEAGNSANLTLDITVDSSSTNNSITSLIPFFAFESKNSSSSITEKTRLGWIYNYIPSRTYNGQNPSAETGITANVIDTFFQAEVKG